MIEALHKPGFTFVEAIAPCPTQFGRKNRQGTGLAQMNYYRDNSIIKHGADPSEVGIALNGPITVGKFVDIERPTFSDLQADILGKALAPVPTAEKETAKPKS